MLDRLPHRIAKRILIDESGCWNWQGHRDKDGYGKSSFQGGTWLAHRMTYTILIGAIPQGHCLDHRCRNPRCCNPLHVDPITRAANTAKGLSISAINSRKTHCIHGHAFDHPNTYLFGTSRHCRKCNAAAASRYKDKQANTIDLQDALEIARAA